MKQWVKFLPAYLLLLFFASSASAQGSFFAGTAYRYTPAGIFAASGAQVTICTSAGAGTPCTPTISVFKDAALANPVANPLPVCGTPAPQFGCIDGIGNFSFYASTPGPYTYTITGVGLTAYGPIPIYSSLSPSANLNLTGAVTIQPPGSLTVSGAGTFTGTTQATGLAACFTNGVAVVGGACAAAWGNGDIHAQMNAAYAALPSTSGNGANKILVIPKSDGSCYTATTQLLLNTNGKAVNIDYQGSCINWTPTGTNAQVYDWGQGNVATGVIVQNLRLLGPCTTTACSGVTANGMVWGVTNGLVNTTFQNIFIGLTGSGSGFLNGINISQGTSFLDYCYSCSIVRNNIGINITSGGGGDIFSGGTSSQNAVGIQTSGSGSGWAAVGMELDDNTTCGYNRAAGSSVNVEFTNVRWEFSAAGSSNCAIQDNVTTGSITVEGGTVLDDFTTSSTATYFPIAATNATNSTNLSIRGLKMQSAGRTVTNAFALGNGTYDINVTLTSATFTSVYTSNLTGALRIDIVSSAGGAQRQTIYINFPATFSTDPLGQASLGSIGYHQSSARMAMNNNNTGLLNLVGTTSGGAATGNAVKWAGSLVDLVDAGGPPAVTIANGTKALNTASITTATCDAGVTATATGAVSTDVVDWSFNAAPTATNKYGAFLVVYAVPSANLVTFYTCNPSATTSTPTAMTVNWSVRRP